MFEVVYNPTGLTYEQFFDLDQQCFPAEPFSREQFNEMRSQHLWVAYIGDRFAGYAAVSAQPAQTHLSRIAVAPELRRTGIADALMKQVVHFSAGRCITLQVQTDNEPAIKLYEKYGFTAQQTSYQFVAPIRALMADHRLVSGVITATENRKPDEVNAATVGACPGVPLRHNLTFVDDTGAVRGSCRLQPDFPGCYPFIVEDPEEYLVDVLLSLGPYLNTEKAHLLLLFSDERLSKECRKLGFKLNYELSKMSRPGMI